MPQNPQHTHVASDPVSTPGYWRMFMTLIMVRYGVRASIDLGFDNKGPVGTLIDRVVNSFARGADKASPEFKKNVKSIATDAINGVLSTTGTLYYAKRVYDDMHNIFSESLAYELDKDPAQIGLRDMFKSENKLVVKARNNLVKFNGARLLSDAMFFTRFIPNFKGEKFEGTDVRTPLLDTSNEMIGTDVAMGVKGIMVTKDILSRDPTFFDTLIRIVDEKINPKNALGDTITTSNIADLFQKYAADHAPEKNFKANGELARWGDAEVIFTRIASLMNDTYRYSGTNLVTQPQNFKLPKFLYLLGNGHIDPSNVKTSLAFVEIFNAHDVQAVKRVAEGLKKGKSIDAYLEEYNVQLPVLKEAVTQQPVAVVSSEKEEEKLATTPSGNTIRAIVDRGPQPMGVAPQAALQPGIG